MITIDKLIKHNYKKKENKTGNLYYKKFNGYNIVFLIKDGKPYGSTIVGDFKHNEKYTIELHTSNTVQQIETVHKYDYNNYVVNKRPIVNLVGIQK